MKYNGTGALSKAYSEMGFAAHDSNISGALTAEAVAALNLKITGNGKYDIDEKIAIVEWVRLNKRLPNGRMPSIPREKTKRDKLFDDFTRIAFHIKSSDKRQFISLEPEYVEALDKITNDRKEWISKTIDDYIDANGVESNTRIIKTAIVKTLMTKW
jgi:hypothetical protein